MTIESETKFDRFVVRRKIPVGTEIVVGSDFYHVHTVEIASKDTILLKTDGALVSDFDEESPSYGELYKEEINGVPIPSKIPFTTTTLRWKPTKFADQALIDEAMRTSSQ